jgi:HPr kinase/phosphorylase
MSCITVEELLTYARERLGNLRASEKIGMSNKIESPCIQRCSIGRNNVKKLIYGLPLILSESFLTRLKAFSPSKRNKIYGNIAAADPPCVMLSKVKCNKEFAQIMKRDYKIPVLSSEFDEYLLESRFVAFLKEKIEKTSTMHGALVNVNGVGVMITGKSGTGKTMCAVTLAREGHFWVADDAIKITRKGEGILYGLCHEKVKNYVDLKNAGIVDARHLFGEKAIAEETVIDMVVKLERSENNNESSDKNQIPEECRVLDVTLPCLRSSAGHDWMVHVRNIEQATRNFAYGGRYI